MYIIVLDEDQKNPDYWTYVAERATEPEIRAVDQYSDLDRQSVSKEDFVGRVDPPKTSVTNKSTGNIHSGTIYELTPKGE